MISPSIRSDPDASMKTSVPGVGPNMNGAVPWRRASPSHRSSSRGLIAWSAPNCCASSRRRRLVSIATTSRTPRSASVAMARRPIGPHPTTATRSPGSTSPWFTACMPTAAGSASAAACRPMVVGDREQASALGRLPDEEERGQATLGCAAAQPAQLFVGRVDDDPVTRRHAVHLCAGPLDHTGHLVTQRHRPARDAAHVHEGDIGAADPTSRHPDDGVARARRRRRDIVEADIVGAVDPDLLHRLGPASVGRTLPSPTAAQYAVPALRPSARPSGIPPGRRGVRAPPPRRCRRSCPTGVGRGGGWRTPSDRCLPPACAISFGARSA